MAGPPAGLQAVALRGCCAWSDKWLRKVHSDDAGKFAAIDIETVLRRLNLPCALAPYSLTFLEI